MVKDFIEHLGIKILHAEGNQFTCQCPICNKDKFYINSLTGLWDCKHGCGNGNPYTLTGRVARIAGKEAFMLLEQFGLGTDAQPAVSVVKKPDKVINIKPDDIIDLPLLDQLIFCDAKKLDRQALLKFEPKRYKKKPIVLLPAFSPENLTHPVGYIRVALDGSKIPIKFKNFDGSWGEKLEKYPVVKGSSPGLVGLPEALKDTSGTIIYAEGWKDAHAAISQGYISVCNSQGAKTWQDEWLPVFEGKIVYIIFDRDKAGVDGGNKAAERIATVAKEVYLVELPYEYTETNGKDLYDYVMEAINHE